MNMNTIENGRLFYHSRCMCVFLVIWNLLNLRSSVEGLNLSPCGTDNTLEVVENKGDNLFTCSGLTSDDTVQWSVMAQNAGSSTDAGRCSPFPSYTCTVEIAPEFTPAREAASTSTMTVAATGTSKVYFKGTSIQCGASQNNMERESAMCKVDLIAKPMSSACNILVNTSAVSSGWTLTVNCTVTGVYSYLERYTCQLVQTVLSVSSPSSTVTMTVVSASNPKYKDGMCDVTVPFPDTSATYSYKMVVTPGRVDVVASFGESDSIRIRRPNSPPSHTCPQYVAETQGVSCTCSATDLGRPAGVVRWSGFPGNRLSLSNVNKTQNGSQFVCEIMWNGGRVQSVVYTIQVAYGPSSASISTPSLPFDTNGSQQVTLTCSASDVNPHATFSWHMLPSKNVEVQGQMVKFTPQPPNDDNFEFECQADNNITGITKTSSATVGLNYPPSSDPVISTTSVPPSTEGDLYQGDRVTLTCSVTGGKPVSATVVTFTCTNKPDSPDTVGSTGVSSSVTFDSLTDSDHNTECTYSTRWKQTDWYNRSNSTTRLFVNSPPSQPTIHPPSTGYPFIATVTQSAILTCESSNPGRPAASYTWPVNHGGRNGTEGSGRVTLTFDTISKEHEGKTVSCKASNRFTVNRRAVPDGNLTLEVYFHPEVHLVPVTDTNQCQPLNSDPSYCLVTEGASVYFQCQATSKPAPKVFSWQPGSGNSSDLYIQSANRTLHTRTYNCSVETGLGDHGNDQRLPLRNSSLLTVLVKYPTTISSLTVNSVTSDNLTVNANDTVTITCRGDGRPSPEMTLFSTTKDAIGHIPQGTPSLQDNIMEVTGSITAQCRHTGIYMCEASNGVGKKQTRPVTVFVRCKPEVFDKGAGDGGTSTTPSVDFTTKAERLSFNFAAYPTPQLNDIKFFQNRPNATSMGKPVKGNTIQVACSRHSVDLFNVTCAVTVDNISSSDAGFYRAVIGNSLGDVKVLFQVTTNNVTIPSPSSKFPVVAAAAGIAAAVLVIGGIALFLILWRRRKGKRQEESPGHGQSEDATNRDTPDMIDNVIYDSSGSKDEVMIVNDIYGTSGHPNDEQRPAGSGVDQLNPYEDVNVTKAKPNVLPKPKAKIPPPSAGPSPLENAEVYAVVKKKTTPVQSSVAKSGSAEDSSKLGGKSKGGNKSKDGTARSNGKGKHKANAKDDKQPLHPCETPGSVYNNMTPLSMSPRHTEGTVYENYAFNKDGVDGNETDQKRAEEQSEIVNPDGLVYTTIAFSTDQQRKAEQPPPEREATEYADIDFMKRVPK